MSYAIVDNGDEINIRAIITQRRELAELVEKLQRRVDGLPLNITTNAGGVEPPIPTVTRRGCVMPTIHSDAEIDAQIDAQIDDAEIDAQIDDAEIDDQDV